MLLQTKLRILGVIVVASLLWTSLTSAASQKNLMQKVNKRIKINYIGTASWYGKRHQGRKMANGKRFDRDKLTAASWYFPLGTSVRVVNVNNGKSVMVMITDRGPNLRLHRIVDLSEAAASNLDYVENGLTRVFLYPVVSVDTASAEFDSSLVESDSSKSPAEYEASALNKAI
jgi:rare lipoprotein A